jgi:hypothetical protein
VTQRPRKYGIHATLKAPFTLAHGVSAAQLCATAAKFAQTQAPVPAGPLHLTYQNGFVALRPRAAPFALNELESSAVRLFDPASAPLTEQQLARRRQARLSTRQDQYLRDWGYPYVFEEFNFHITLTGRVGVSVGAHIKDKLAPQVTAVVQDPLMIDAISLMGEDAEGFFHQIERFPLKG